MSNPCPGSGNLLSVTNTSLNTGGVLGLAPNQSTTMTRCQIYTIFANAGVSTTITNPSTGTPYADATGDITYNNSPLASGQFFDPPSNSRSTSTPQYTWDDTGTPATYSLCTTNPPTALQLNLLARQKNPKSSTKPPRHLPVYKATSYAKPCPFRYPYPDTSGVPSYCLEASSCTGTLVPVTPDVCENTCKLGIPAKFSGGPYLGRQITVQNKNLWLTNMVDYQAGRNKMHKTRTFWSMGRVMGFPAMADPTQEFSSEVNNDFTVFIQNQGLSDLITGIGLAGSSLLDGNIPKDIDVIVVVSQLTSWIDFINNPPNGSFSWPSKIGSSLSNGNTPNYDVFVHGSFESVHMMLDINKNILYTNAVYSKANAAGLTDPNGDSPVIVMNSMDTYFPQ
jgi:hypothetical protein